MTLFAMMKYLTNKCPPNVSKILSEPSTSALDFLVHALGTSVCLRVVRRCQPLLDLQQVAKVSPELPSPVGAPIAVDGSGPTVEPNPAPKESPGAIFGFHRRHGISHGMLEANSRS